LLYILEIPCYFVN